VTTPPGAVATASDSPEPETTRAAPPGFTVGWQLVDPPQVEYPALWERAGVVADPLGGRERPGWLEQAFLGRARLLDDGRVEVDYGPGRGLRLQVGVGLAAFLHGDEPALCIGVAEDAALVRAPNDAGPTHLILGRARWERPTLAVRCLQRPIDQGRLTLRVPAGGVSVIAREAMLRAGTTRLPFEWGAGERTLELSPDAADAVRVDGIPQAGLDVLSLADDDRPTPWLELAEGEWAIRGCWVAGRCLRPDRAALCWAPTPVGARSGGRLRFEGEPTPAGGPLVAIGPRRGGRRVAAELLRSSFMLRVGTRVLASVEVPSLEAGTITLTRRAEQLSARLEGAGVDASLEAELPEPLPGVHHVGYGSTAPRIVCREVTVWRGEDDVMRADYDAAEDPPAHLAGADSPRQRWWLGAWSLRPLLDPTQALGLGLVGAAEARLAHAREALALLEDAAAGLQRPSAQRDARCRALVAAVAAGDVERAAALSLVLGQEPAAARATLEGLAPGLVLSLATGFQAIGEEEAVVEAALLAVEPLLATDEERTHVSLSWAAHLNALAPDDASRSGEERRAHFERVLEHLRSAERTASGEAERTRVHTHFARAYGQLGLFEEWEHHMRQVLANPAGGAYPNNWAEYGKGLLDRGRTDAAIEALLGAAVRDRGRARRRAVIVDLLQRARPDASTTAVALYVIASLEAGDAWLTHPLGKQALSAVQATLQAPDVAENMRGFDLARYVVSRTGGEVEAPEAPQRPTEWLLVAEPTADDLALAGRDDLLVSTLVRLDPRLASRSSGR
jgi:tetratricopeptide (TPR) repeat protein